MKTTLTAVTLAAMTLLAPLASHATSYAGNGATGFGGTLGNGTLNVTSTPDGGITFSLAPALRGTNNTLDNNVVALYLDTKAGGSASTALFADSGDGGRIAISGENPANAAPNRSVATFAPGFGADYALAIEQNFVGVFDLSTGATGGSFNFLFGQNQTTPPYTITLTPTQAASIGINPGGTVNFVGSLIATGGFRSNETIGPSVSVPGPITGGGTNPGNEGTVTFSSSDSYTLAPAPVPEPSGLVSLLVATSVLGGLIAARRRVSAH